MAKGLEGLGPGQRVVVVTGGLGRIGGAIAAALLSQGDFVIVIDRKSAPEESRQNEDADKSPIVRFQADLAVESETRHVFQSIRERFGHIDAAVLCAGDFKFGPLLEHTADDFERLFRNNVLTAFLCLHELVRTIPQDRGGHVVFMGTIVDHRVVRGNSIYGATKAALRMLCDVVREETRDSKLRITNLCLGAVASPMARQLEGNKPASTLSPNIVVDAVLWLLKAPPEPRFDELRLFPPVGVNDV